MKQFKLTFLLIVLMSMVGAKASAHDIEVKNADDVTIYYTYMNNETELAVSYRGSGYSSYSNEYSGVVNIPESVTYNGTIYPVTSIGYQAFYYCSGLTSVTIGNSVTSIGAGAFSGCSGLTSVIIPNSLTSIGQSAFNGCSGLTSVTIPNSVTSIGYYAFNGCSSLTSVTIPNSVTSIGHDAFYACSGLTSVTIGNSVTSIGEYAFRGCSGLTSVTIPNSVTSIGQYAFSGCSGLTSVTINSNAIASKNYTSSSSLKDIFGSQVKQYVVGDSVKSVGYYAFWGCTGLTSVTIGNSVTSIGSSAFQGCSGLTSVTIPNSVTSIGSSAFQGCSGLQKVIINDIAAWCNISFESNPLYYAKHLYSDENTEIKNLVIPDEVTSIKDYAFQDCSGLTSVTIPNSVTSIGESAFSGCNLMKVIWLPSTPPSGYGDVSAIIHYVPNNSYTSLSRKTVYPYLTSIFEVDGVKYVLVSPSEKTCDAIDCVYDTSVEDIKIGNTVTYRGIAMTVKNVNSYLCYANPYVKM